MRDGQQDLGTLLAGVTVTVQDRLYGSDDVAVYLALPPPEQVGPLRAVNHFVPDPKDGHLWGSTRCRDAKTGVERMLREGAPMLAELVVRRGWPRTLEGRIDALRDQVRRLGGEPVA